MFVKWTFHKFNVLTDRVVKLSEEATAQPIHSETNTMFVHSCFIHFITESSLEEISLSNHSQFLLITTGSLRYVAENLHQKGIFLFNDFNDDENNNDDDIQLLAEETEEKLKCNSILDNSLLFPQVKNDQGGIDSNSRKFISLNQDENVIIKNKLTQVETNVETKSTIDPSKQTKHSHSHQSQLEKVIQNII